MTRISILLVFLTFTIAGLKSQSIPIPAELVQEHPRLLTTNDNKQALVQLIENEQWANEVLNGIKNRLDPYVERTQSQPDWMYSRLMMYWKSKASNVFIKGGLYSHATGTAPVATVRFGSTRGVYSAFRRPKLEDIVPYMDDTKGVYFHNTSKPDHPLEWIEQSQISGGSIESVNEEIMRYAKDASFMYWLTEDEKYAKFAFDILDTYLQGIYHRSEPVDLNNGHAQTLVGYSTFEVIQERILNELAYTYDFLYPWIENKHPEKLTIYAEALKKWIDVSIKNGVPHNNWNLHQAKFILKVAMVLEDNRKYTDQKGRQYYIDFILNRSSARQWSLPRFMTYGYDFNTGIWNECPGYATGVTKDLTDFIVDYDNTFNQNILPFFPVLKKAVTVLPQYLFPNDDITAFGDTYYGRLNTIAVRNLIRLAQKYNNREDEVELTKQLYFLDPNEKKKLTKQQYYASQIGSFFSSDQLQPDLSIEAGKREEYITQTFYAPNVSWFVQRNKYDSKENGLMISQYASYGNHAHSNGIAIELYGKGYVLGAESGIGSSYFEKEYLEYYSQFPAHNTVMVDGVSKYPEMLSNHPFDLLSCYPQSEQQSGFYSGISFSDVYFLEPESRSDQNRLLSIVSTGETTGYYVDIFRSKKQRGGDKFHDYFYHNLGQELIVKNADGSALDFHPSDEMAFAGGHLFALDYMWDKKSARSTKDYEAVWKMSFPDGHDVSMNLWMKGYEGREIFTIKAPSCKAFRDNHNLPYNVKKEPYLTISARQHGEAWNKPFVSVFEPTTNVEGRSIKSIMAFTPDRASDDFVGLIVESKSGRKDYIFSSVNDEIVKYKSMSTNATYAVISQQGNDFVLFMGNGTSVSANGFSIVAKEKTNAVLEFKNGAYYIHSDKPVRLKAPSKREIQIKATEYREIKL